MAYRSQRPLLADEDLRMLPRLYTELAPWWPLLSPPDAYTEDALVVYTLIEQTLGRRPRSLLELGCGSTLRRRCRRALRRRRCLRLW